MLKGILKRLRDIWRRLRGKSDDVIKSTLRKLRRKLREKLDELEKAKQGKADSLEELMAEPHSTPESERLIRTLEKIWDEEIDRIQKEVDKLKDQIRQNEKLQASVSMANDAMDGMLAMMSRHYDKLSANTYDADTFALYTKLEDIALAACPCPEDEETEPIELPSFGLEDVDFDRMSHALSDKGLEEFAIRYALPSPSAEASMKLARQVAYAAIAMPLIHLEEDRPDMSVLYEEMIADLPAYVEEVVKGLKEQPEEALALERNFQKHQATHLQEIMWVDNQEGVLYDIQEGENIAMQVDEACERLKIRKSLVLKQRYEKRNWLILKSVLVVLGVDFILELVEDFKDEDGVGVIIDLLSAGFFAKAVYNLIKLLKRLSEKPGFWEKLVKKYGRFGALKKLAFLGGKLVPAITLMLLVHAWYEIYKEWAEKDKEYMARLREIYNESNCESKDKLFKKNGFLDEVKVV